MSQAEIEFEKWFTQYWGLPNYDHVSTRQLKDCWIAAWYKYIDLNNKNELWS